MDRQPRDNPSLMAQAQEGMNAVIAVGRVISMCFWPLLRSRWGTEGFGMAAGLAFLILILLTPDPIMAIYLWIWLIAVVIRRAEAWKLYRQGAAIHSQFQGQPCLKGLSYENATIFGEPIIIAVTGLLLAGYSQTAGMFFLCGAMAMFVTALSERMMLRRQVMQMRDTEILMRNYRSMYRNHDRW